MSHAWIICPLCVGLLALAPLACSQVRCKEAGCFAGAQVVYDQSLPTPYELTVRTAGLSLSAHCPVDARSSRPVAPNAATLVCDASGFTVSTANAANGSATQYGTNPVDANSLNFDVALSRAGAAPIQRAVRVTLTHVERPNGPDCPSVCYSRQGTMGLPP